MSTKLLLPIVAVLAIGGAAAGAAVYLAAGEDSVPQAVAQPTPTPAPASTATFTATPTAPAATTTPEPSDGTPAPEGLATYEDAEFGFSMDYPAEWSASEVPLDPQVSDLLKGVEFVGKGGVPRASVFVYQNPRHLSLEDWIKDHDAIFLDRPPQEVTIDGARALVAPLNFAGQPSPLAYIEKGSLIFGIKGLTDEDYQQAVAGFKLTD